jgi:membrane-bound lytic murein transglycosylase D
MAGILSEKGLPKELAYLPIVESGFNPQAYSHRRAAGLWQFYLICRFDGLMSFQT